MSHHKRPQPLTTADELADLKETIREGHRLLKAMNASIREAREVVDREVRGIVVQTLDEASKDAQRVILHGRDAALKRMVDEFNRLGRLMLRVDSPTGVTIEQIAEFLGHNPGIGILSSTGDPESVRLSSIEFQETPTDKPITTYGSHESEFLG